MRNSIIAFAFLVAASSAAHSEAAKADPRAVDACQRSEAAFTAVADCIPDMDVAFAGLDAFDSAASDGAKPLKEACLELNKDPRGAWVCIINATKKAVELKEMLPSGSEVSDPVFRAVSERSFSDLLVNAESEAQARYPNKGLWGGTPYFPYK